MSSQVRPLGVSLLLELMLGLALTGVVAVLALGSFVTVSRSQNHSMDVSLANGLARQVMEAQRALDYSAINSIGTQEVVHRLELQSTEVHRRFTYQVEVSQPWSPDPVKSVVVTVRWPFAASQPGGAQHQVRLQTCVGPY